jgi:hypothetical protein
MVILLLVINRVWRGPLVEHPQVTATIRAMDPKSSLDR